MLEDLLLAPVTDPDANAWANAVQGAGGFVTGPQRRRVATLVRALKASSVWPLLDRFWLFAAENPVQALIDLRARSTATVVAGGAAPIFTANRGYRGQNSGYIDSNFNPAIGSPNFTRNSGFYSPWVETPDTTNTDRIMGNNSSNFSEIAVGVTNLAYSISQGSATGSNTTISSTGLMTVGRSGANATSFDLNGVQAATGSAASIAIPNNNFFILAGNNGGSAFQASGARIAMAAIGGSLTLAQRGSLFAASRTYMTAVGVP